MYSASLIAAAFVKKAIDEGNPITQMQLQKMVFFAQGYNLAVKGEPLIKEEFQAWQYGPVVPKIYDTFKLYGSNPISNTDRIKLNLENDLSSLDADALEAIQYTWNATRHLSARELSNWTHLKGSPWHQVYKPNDYGIIIDRNRIETYFKDFLVDENQAKGAN